MDREVITLRADCVGGTVGASIIGQEYCYRQFAFALFPTFLQRGEASQGLFLAIVTGHQDGDPVHDLRSIGSAI